MMSQLMKLLVLSSSVKSTHTGQELVPYQQVPENQLDIDYLNHIISDQPLEIKNEPSLVEMTKKYTAEVIKMDERFSKNSEVFNLHNSVVKELCKTKVKDLNSTDALSDIMYSIYSCMIVKASFLAQVRMFWGITICFYSDFREYYPVLKNKTNHCIVGQLTVPYKELKTAMKMEEKKISSIKKLIKDSSVKKGLSLAAKLVKKNVQSEGCLKEAQNMILKIMQDTCKEIEREEKNYKALKSAMNKEVKKHKKATVEELGTILNGVFDDPKYTTDSGVFNQIINNLSLLKQEIEHLIKHF